jgi:hypothetical protein
VPVLVAAVLHPLLLILLFPIVGERANLTIVFAPFAAAWLFSLRLSMVFLLLNALGTSAVFAHLTLVGPREGRQDWPSLSSSWGCSVSE